MLSIAAAQNLIIHGLLQKIDTPGKRLLQDESLHFF
jgi:hypothetical protein